MQLKEFRERAIVELGKAAAAIKRLEDENRMLDTRIENTHTAIDEFVVLAKISPQQMSGALGRAKAVGLR